MKVQRVGTIRLLVDLAQYSFFDWVVSGFAEVGGEVVLVSVAFRRGVEHFLDPGDVFAAPSLTPWNLRLIILLEGLLGMLGQ